MGDGREDVGIFDELQRRRPACRFLIFCRSAVRRASRRPRRRRSRRRPAAPFPPRPASAARFPLDDGHARRIGQIDRAGDQHDIGAGGGCRRGNGVALFARGAVGDVAHRIDRLAGRAGGDQDALAGRGRSARWRAQEPFGARRRSPAARPCGPVPASPRSAISPALGPTIRTPSRCKLRDIALRRRGRPHLRVHRRRQQDRFVGREQDGGGEIVGMAVRHFRHQVGGRRRDHDQIAVAREPDMADVELALADRTGRYRRARRRARRRRAA